MSNEGLVPATEVVVDVNEPYTTSHTSTTKWEPIDPKLAAQGTTYTWDNINVYSGSVGPGCCKKNGKSSHHILQNVSGVVRPGELLALMGASGAGKTTLLNVLHFNSGNLNVTGDRCINGTVVGANVISRLSAYVQQEDLFIPSLTVYEHLLFTSRVRMDPKLSHRERLQRVEDVIHDLGLTKCRNAKIGDPAVAKGISGGEMKRLAFAAEFLTDPKLMFCDEPTSGLDAFMAQSVVNVMQRMAKLGKAIICTIHQPASEVFEMFDRICLLSGGRVAFLGTIPEALDFFSESGYPCPLNHNPADFFIFEMAIVPGNEEACRTKTQAICDAYERSNKAAEIEAIAKFRSDAKTLTGFEVKMSERICGSYRANWCVQFNALIRRAFISYYREPMLCLARIIQSIAMSLIVGFIFADQSLNQAGVKNLSSCIFIIVLNMSLMNVFGVIFVFSVELPIFLREHWNSMYRADAYFVAKTTAELPFVTFYAVLFNLICYFLVGLRAEPENFLMCCFVSILVANCSCGFGYLISTATKSLVVALAITPPLLVPLLLFSGFFLKQESTPEFWHFAHYGSWFYYACEILFENQWLNLDKNITNENPEKLAYLQNGEQVITFYGYRKHYNMENMLSLVAMTFGFRILAFLCLLMRTRGRGQ